MCVGFVTGLVARLPKGTECVLNLLPRSDSGSRYPISIASSRRPSCFSIAFESLMIKTGRLLEGGMGGGVVKEGDWGK